MQHGNRCAFLFPTARWVISIATSCYHFIIFHIFGLSKYQSCQDSSNSAITYHNQQAPAMASKQPSKWRHESFPMESILIPKSCIYRSVLKLYIKFTPYCGLLSPVSYRCCAPLTTIQQQLLARCWLPLFSQVSIDGSHWL